MRQVIYIVLAVIILSGCAAREVKPPEKTVFYPALPLQPRIQFLVSIHSEDDLEIKRSLEEFLLGQKKQTRKVIQRVYDVDSVRGKIYLVDRGYKRILIIDLEKREIDLIRTGKNRAILDPAGLWVTEDDIKYVADMAKKQIIVFDKNKEFVRAYGGPEVFGKPMDVAVFGNLIYVCDFAKHKIHVLNKKTGEIIREIGGMGIEPGKMYKPTHISLDDEGFLYVNDSSNFRIQVFNKEGNFVKSIGSQGDVSGTFAMPKGIDIDRQKRLYAVDAAFENVQIFDVNTSDLLLFFGGSGPGTPGSMNLPAGMKIDYENVDYFQKYTDKNFKIEYIVYICNMLGNKDLNIYGFGEWIGPPLSKR